MCSFLLLMKETQFFIATASTDPITVKIAKRYLIVSRNNCDCVTIVCLDYPCELTIRKLDETRVFIVNTDCEPKKFMSDPNNLFDSFDIQQERFTLTFDCGCEIIVHDFETKN
jgi:hypothetical protein